jgi:hypothetical protein
MPEPNEQLRLKPYDYGLVVEPAQPTNGVSEEKVDETSQGRRMNLVAKGFYPGLSGVSIEEIPIPPPDS